MVYLVRVESRKRIKGMKLAANIVATDVSNENQAIAKAKQMFAAAYELPIGMAVVTEINLEVA